MKSLSLKRTLRLEKKKKKMAALIEICKLNECDRETKSAHMKRFNSESKIGCVETQPSPKRSRTEPENQTISLGSHKEESGDSNKPGLEGEDYLTLKKAVKERSNLMKAQPIFRLRQMGENASLGVDSANRIPLFLSDVQHLIMYSQIGTHSPYTPSRWCSLEKFHKIKCTTILVLEDISVNQFMNYTDLFPFLNSKFEYKLEIVTPAAYKADVVQDLATVPLTRTQMKKFEATYGSLHTAVKESDELFDRIKNLFPIDGMEKEGDSAAPVLPKGDKFPRTHLLLSGWQMVEENFPLPIEGLMETKYKDYVNTKDEYKYATHSSPMFSLDCEMCLTTSGLNELTRISIVDEDLKVFYEQLVKPENKIVDYLTRFSGITAKMMKNVSKNLRSVQKDLREILPSDAILIGQSLNSDMHALKMMHPYIIDTSVIFNVTGDRARKSKLKDLSQQFLQEKIQGGSGGHCSVEDSRACMKLVKKKLSRHLSYGDAVAEGGKNSYRLQPQMGSADFATSMLRQVTKVDCVAKIVAKSETIKKYKYYTFKDLNAKDKSPKITCVSKGSNEEIIDDVCKADVNHKLNIAHIKLGADETNRLRSVDKWVEKIYENLMLPGMCIVIFAGDKKTGNGCCFVQLKRCL